MSAKISFVKLSAVILLTLLVLLYAGSAIAQDATSAATTPRKTQPIIAQQRPAAEKIEERLEALREKVASKEAVLKQRLTTFRDKQKAQVAERINLSLNRINQKMTSAMLNHLDRMSEILAKLETRVNRGTPDIKDVGVAKEAIASASASIALAKNEVVAQSEKDYTLAISSETRVRQDVVKTKDQLQQDLRIIRVMVIEAKQAVANAIRVAKSGKVIEPLIKEATESGQ